MSEMQMNVGAVIRAERQKQGLSLDEASAKTGVSKAMLGQIERGESNPTVSTVWKISVGLRIPVARLLSQQNSSSYKVQRLKDLQPTVEDGGKIRLYTIVPFDPVNGLDYLYIQFEPGVYYASTGHPDAIEEYVVVTEGELTLHLAGQTYVLGPGDSITFAGKENHAYENRGDKTLVYQSVVRY